MAHLEGPADLGAKLDDEAEDRIAGHLQGARRSFDEGRPVQSQLPESAARREQARTEAREKATEERAACRKDIETQRSQVTRTLADIDTERHRIHDEQQQDEAGVMKDVRQADAERMQAESQMAPVATQWNLMGGSAPRNGRPP